METACQIIILNWMCYIMHNTTTLVEMNDEFRQRILDGYDTDPAWSKILSVLRANDNTRLQVKLPFVWEDRIDSDASDIDSGASNIDRPVAESRPVGPVAGYIPPGESCAVAVRVPVRDAYPAAFEKRLIYHIDKSIGLKRLCIPDAVVKDVLSVPHSAQGHMGFARCYERVATSWYQRFDTILERLSSTLSRVFSVSDTQTPTLWQYATDLQSSGAIPYDQH